VNDLPPQANRVLVVEDDPHLAAGVVENLRAEGYETHSVTDGRQALDWLGAQHVGLIVLDVMLPEVDGFTVCRTLRAQGNNTPVLFLTARGDPADARFCDVGIGIGTPRRRPRQPCCTSAGTRWTSAPSAPAPGTA
jgi:CheY-like chemotaxis protein